MSYIINGLACFFFLICFTQSPRASVLVEDSRSSEVLDLDKKILYMSGRGNHPRAEKPLTPHACKMLQIIGTIDEKQALYELAKYLENFTDLVTLDLKKMRVGLDAESLMMVLQSCNLRHVVLPNIKIVNPEKFGKLASSFETLTLEGIYIDQEKIDLFNLVPKNERAPKIIFVRPDFGQGGLAGLIHLVESSRNIECDLRGFNTNLPRELIEHLEHFDVLRENGREVSILMDPYLVFDAWRRLDGQLVRDEDPSFHVGFLKYASAFGHQEAFVRLGEFVGVEGGISDEDYQDEILRFQECLDSKEIDFVKLMLVEKRGMEGLKEAIRNYTLNFFSEEADYRSSIRLGNIYRTVHRGLEEPDFNDLFEFLLREKFLENFVKNDDLKRRSYSERRSVLKSAAKALYEISSQSNSVLFSQEANLNLALVNWPSTDDPYREDRIEEVKRYLGEVIAKSDSFSSLRMRAEFHLGEIHEQSKELQEAEEIYRLLSEKGHTYAQFKLGKLLLSGIENGVFECDDDVDSALREALQCYQRAAHNGSLYAQYALLGILKNKVVGIHRIGDKHFIEQGISKEVDFWKTKLMDQKHVLTIVDDAKDRVDSIGKHPKSSQEIEIAMNAVRLLRGEKKQIRVEDENDPSVLDTLGYICAYYHEKSLNALLGIGSWEDNKGKAEKYYREAIKLGNISAQINFGWLLYDKVENPKHYSWRSGSPQILLSQAVSYTNFALKQNISQNMRQRAEDNKKRIIAKAKGLGLDLEEIQLEGLKNRGSATLLPSTAQEIMNKFPNGLFSYLKENGLIDEHTPLEILRILQPQGMARYDKSVDEMVRSFPGKERYWLREFPLKIPETLREVLGNCVFTTEVDKFYSNIFYYLAKDSLPNRVKGIAIKLAAEAGNPFALYRLSSGAFEKNIKERKKNIIASARQGYSKALYTLSCAYDGTYSDFDLQYDVCLASELCRMAADGGYGEAIFKIRVGRFLDGTLGEKRDFLKGLNELLSLVNDGSKIALDCLKSLYEMPTEVYEEVYEGLASVLEEFIKDKRPRIESLLKGKK